MLDQNQKLSCDICLHRKTLVDKEYLKTLNLNFYNFLKSFCLLGVCKDCAINGYIIYQEDMPRFFEWLDEHDNRPSDHENIMFIQLRQEFGITESALVDSHATYVENLEKYILYLENLISAKLTDITRH